VACLLHNGEEALTMPSWLAAEGAGLPLHPGPALLRLLLLLLTAAAFFLSWLCARRGPQSLAAYLCFGLICAMLLNVFVPHLPATLVLRRYTPGTATALLVNLPVMALLARRALDCGWVSGGRALRYALFVPVALAGLILLTFALSDRL
jgi:hypothetical protein